MAYERKSGGKEFQPAWRRKKTYWDEKSERVDIDGSFVRHINTYTDNFELLYVQEVFSNCHSMITICKRTGLLGHSVLALTSKNSI